LRHDRGLKRKKTLGRLSPKDISDTHLLPYITTILDDIPNKMDDPGIPTFSYLISTQKFDQAL
jgi:hypothetical protein